ncbi:aspartyl protease family protein [Candidatus Micrarchaeota archaeon]|nr:aspartyl protease family protein [Candidatus Micrarchaeota archaeon]
MMAFTYQEHGGRHYPSLNIELCHLDKRVAAEALVDSGANFCLFKAEFADALGIPIERGTKVLFKGIGGDLACYRHVLTFRIAGRDFEWPVYFSRQFRFSMNLLGRGGFFEPFDVTFRERRKELVLTEAHE